MADIIKVGITPGDFNGIGYEIIIKSLSDATILEIFTPIIYGIPSLIEKARIICEITEMPFNIITDPKDIEDGKINILAISNKEIEPTPGTISKVAGELAALSLEKATNDLKKGLIDVLVTAPISKEAIQGNNFSFPGHTEYLESVTESDEKALMILCNDSLRVALLTIHVPITKVAESITTENIKKTISIFSSSLKKDFGIERPTIAVLSLNPHAGDGGVIGTEEEEIIKPAIIELQQEGDLVFGPFPADGFFGHGSYKAYDGILAMYHDQGLAPFKTIAASTGVNFTAGLPFIRTSPDHGTAFDIAWKGIADETSMRNAIYMAIDIYRKRRTYVEATANPLKKHVIEKPDRGERQDKPLKLTNLSDNGND